MQRVATVWPGNIQEQSVPPQMSVRYACPTPIHPWQARGTPTVYAMWASQDPMAKDVVRVKPGNPINGPGNALCTACAATKYSGDLAATSDVCKACPTNSNLPQGSTLINQCLCNTSFSGENGAFCNQCGAGKYKIATGKAACTNCAPAIFDSTRCHVKCVSIMSSQFHFTRVVRQHQQVKAILDSRGRMARHAHSVLPANIRSRKAVRDVTCVFLSNIQRQWAPMLSIRTSVSHVPLDPRLPREALRKTIVCVLLGTRGRTGEPANSVWRANLRSPLEPMRAPVAVQVNIQIK